MANAFRSNGKLLLTGEYVVLDGALSLAVPTKYGQSLLIEPNNTTKLKWTSLDKDGDVWFETSLNIKDIDLLSTESENDINKRLIQIIKAAKELNPNFLISSNGFEVTTVLDFSRDWGLGTSSTLINNIAQWAAVNPYHLLKKTFGGSGYDIACAQYNTAISYQLQNKTPVINQVEFNPTFKEHLYFVHLNKKQNSREGITYYHNHKAHSKAAIRDINTITQNMIESRSFENFEHLINQHEHIISKITKQTSVNDLLFNDFNGSTKSLGAWGGDFILATSKENPSAYFNQKGYKTIVPYIDMVL